MRALLSVGYIRRNEQQANHRLCWKRRVDIHNVYLVLAHVVDLLVSNGGNLVEAPAHILLVGRLELGLGERLHDFE